MRRSAVGLCDQPFQDLKDSLLIDVLYAATLTACSSVGGPKISGCRMRASISTPSTTRGPGRLKYEVASVAQTSPLLTAGKSSQPAGKLAPGNCPKCLLCNNRRVSTR